MGRGLTIAALAAMLLAGSAHGAYEPAGVVRDFVDLTDYLPVGEPNMQHHDNSTGAQLAATTLCARNSNGGRVFVPAVARADYYVFHDVLNTCGNTWEGDGPSGTGDLHQPGTPTSFVTMGGTAVDYSGASQYFMQWQVPNFPAFVSNGHMNGGGIHGFTLRDNVSTATALVSLGTQDWKARDIIINGAYNGVYMKGTEFPVTSYISMYGTRNKNYEIVGDLSGQTQGGGACSPSNADCSTRNDVWFGEYLTNIDNTQTNTVFTITGFVATTTLSHTNSEGPAYGMVVSCPAGLQSNGGECPGFGRFYDIQIENFKYSGVTLTDFNNYTFDRLYSVGDGTTNNNNNIYISSINYTGSSIPVGRLTLTNSELFATGGDCVLLGGTLWDIELINNTISACNIANNNWSAIDSPSSTTVTDLKIIGNTIGAVDDYGGPHPLWHAVAVGAGTTNAMITNNLFNPSGGIGYALYSGGVYTQVAPVANGSAAPETVHVADNLGPGGSPQLGTCVGGSLSASSSDTAMILTITGTTSTCTINLGSIQTTAPIVNVTGAPGASASFNASSSNYTVTLAGTLTGSYSIGTKQP